MGLKIPSYNVKVICNNPKSSLEGLMKKDAKKKKWVLKRHKVIRNVLFGTLGVFSRLRYRIKIKKFREDKKRNYLVLFNHQTAFDQFFVGISFKEPVYFVASEDIFTKGWVQKHQQRGCEDTGNKYRSYRRNGFLREWKHLRR